MQASKKFEYTRQHLWHKSLWIAPKIYIYIDNFQNQTPAVAPTFLQKGTGS